MCLSLLVLHDMLQLHVIAHKDQLVLSLVRQPVPVFSVDHVERALVSLILIGECCLGDDHHIH